MMMRATETAQKTVVIVMWEVPIPVPEPWYMWEQMGSGWKPSMATVTEAESAGSPVVAVVTFCFGPATEINVPDH